LAPNIAVPTLPLLGKDCALSEKGVVETLKRWAAATFLRPQSITLLDLPAAETPSALLPAGPLRFSGEPNDVLRTLPIASRPHADLFDREPRILETP
jgi:hypothetical protein